MRIILAFLICSPAWAQFVPVGFTHVGGGGGSTITLIQDRGDGTHGGCNAGAGGSTSITCAFSSSPTHGNVVVAVCYTYNTSCTVSDNAGTDTYSQVALTLQGGSTGSILSNCIESADTHKVVCLWYSVNVQGSLTLKYTVAAGSFIIGHQYEFQNITNTSPLDQEIANSTDGGISGGGTVSATTSTTGQSNELIIMGCNFESNTTITPGTGYTLGMNDASVGTMGVTGMEIYSTVNSIAAQNPNGTTSNSLSQGFTCGVGTLKHS